MTAMQELFQLSGRVAIITGGSRGLGVQIAEALAEAGAHVVLTARKAADLDDAAAGLRARGLAASAIAADLGQPGSPASLCEQVLRAQGRIDILVNNAGATWGAAAEDFPPEAWDKVINVNLTAVFQLAQAVAKQAMIPARTGRILNIASVEGLRGHHWAMPPTVAYSASKGAVVNLTRALAAEWGPHGIAVNAIAPGWFPTKMTHGTLAQHEGEILSRTPLGRLGGSDDLKGAALLLCSDAGRHISGQILAVDGGASAI
ncbi:MAG: glucose 1-dehydrogenase [Acetobacteraceae bacterium]|nr:glucose 1-dehydrogenase [Acetobacteraceae bacterium]